LENTMTTATDAARAPVRALVETTYTRAELERVDVEDLRVGNTILCLTRDPVLQADRLVVRRVTDLIGGQPGAIHVDDGDPLLAFVNPDRIKWRIRSGASCSGSQALPDDVRELVAASVGLLDAQKSPALPPELLEEAQERFDQAVLAVAGRATRGFNE